MTDNEAKETVEEADFGCPWNPFPKTSAWGRRIEELHREELARQKAENIAKARGGS